MVLPRSAVSCTARYPKSISFSGWPGAKLAVSPAWPVSVDAVAYPLRSAAASAAYWIKAFQPPLPTSWNLPFQPDICSHVSDLMSESGEGLMVNSTRQNAGRSAKPSAAPAALVGGWKCPAGTTCAEVMVASGSLSEERRVHAAASAACAAGGASALTVPA